MGEVIHAINEETNGDAIIVTDVGQHQMVACRYAKFTQSKSNITSGGLGTMGFALPAALGAKMGAPEREVVAIIGDGGYQMTIQELGTIFQTGAAVKIVVLNNNFLGMVRQWQQLFFDKRYASTELVNLDFVTIAKGYFIDGEKIDKRNQLKNAVKKLIKSTKPCLLEVCVEKEDNVFPMIPTGESVSNIRLFMMNKTKKFTVSIYTENNLGLLNRISAIFLKRHLSIDSINSSPCEIEDIFRFVIVLKAEEQLIKKVITQLEKQVEVIAAFYHTDQETIFQESALYKVKTQALFQERKVHTIIKNSHANIVTVSPEYFVIEKTGKREETEKLYSQLEPFGILQFVRSGRISVTKEPMKITEILANT